MEAVAVGGQWLVDEPGWGAASGVQGGGTSGANKVTRQARRGMTGGAKELGGWQGA